MHAQNNLFTVDEQSFTAQVLQSTLPVIVEFGADRCPPCRVLAPVYERLSQEYEGQLRFASIDSDENMLISAQLGIQAIPTLILFKEGKPVSRIVGPHPARLKQSIDNALAESALTAGKH